MLSGFTDCSRYPTEYNLEMDLPHVNYLGLRSDGHDLRCAFYPFYKLNSRVDYEWRAPAQAVPETYEPVLLKKKAAR